MSLLCALLLACAGGSPTPAPHCLGCCSTGKNRVLNISRDGTARSLRWSIDEAGGSITLELAFPADAGGSSYVGIGFDRHGRHPMSGTDMVVARATTAAAGSAAPVVEVHDMFARRVGVVERDARPSDLVLLEASVNASTGVARARLRRALKTGDAQDADLSLRAPLRLSFAHGAGGAGGGGLMSYHGERAGSYSLDLFGGGALEISSGGAGGAGSARQLRALHAQLMLVLWGGGVALGISVKRYCGSSGWHARILAGTAGVGSFFGIVVAHFFVEKDVDSVHAVCGIALVSAAFVQGLLGYWLRHYKKKHRDRIARKPHLYGDRPTLAVGGSSGGSGGGGSSGDSGGGGGGGGPKRACGARVFTCVLLALYGRKTTAERRLSAFSTAHRWGGATLQVLALFQIHSGLVEYHASPLAFNGFYAWVMLLCVAFFTMERWHRRRLRLRRERGAVQQAAAGADGTGGRADAQLTSNPMREPGSSELAGGAGGVGARVGTATALRRRLVVV